jgi:hypothetical protein
LDLTDLGAQEQVACSSDVVFMGEQMHKKVANILRYLVVRVVGVSSY